MKSFLAATFLCLFMTAIAQDYPLKNYDLEKIAENIFPVQNLDIDYSQLYENLAQILSNPIDLNMTTDEQLRSLYILNEPQITNFLKYRDELGPLLTVYELQSVDGFDLATVNNLIPFVTVRSNSSDGRSVFKRILHEQNNYLLLRYNRTIEDRRGYNNDNTSASRYLGSADRIYTRFRVARASDFSFGFTFEKDAGERLEWSPSNKEYGFDYYSVHAQLLNKGKIRNLIVGDFQSQFGQGLVLGGGFGVGKGAEAITTVRRSNTGFIPYTSLIESGFFRGVALSIEPIKNLTAHFFASGSLLDGSVASDSTLSSISIAGLHRTENELSNRKILSETNYGGIISFKKRSFEVGSIFHQTQFSLPIARNPTPYNQFYFEGDKNSNISAYLNYSWNNISVFSEAAHTLNGGNGIVFGALANLIPQFDIALLYRNFDRDFQSLYGNAFSENSSPQNEAGLYFGWKYKFNKKHSLTGYYDLFQFPWLRYRSYTPSAGHEWLARYSYQPNKAVFIYLQAREESKLRNGSKDTSLFVTESGLKRNYWVNLDYEVDQKFSFKSRAQFSTFSFGETTTSGFALIQDFNFRMRRVTLSTRFALFDTDDYDNRQYAYEKDVWLAYSFPAYNGVGVRNYVLLQYALTRNIDIWARWSRIQFEDRETIGSGSETIDGNTMNDVKFQARIRF
ncbi:MAG: helix-hairpin-helix domain-containing protein [Cyclobacteriaceae bacterium]